MYKDSLEMHELGSQLLQCFLGGKKKKIKRSVYFAVDRRKKFKGNTKALSIYFYSISPFCLMSK